jgi:hypothetical protein
MKLCGDSDFEKLSKEYIKIYCSWGGHNEKGLMAIEDLIAYLSKMKDFNSGKRITV